MTPTKWGEDILIFGFDLQLKLKHYGFARFL